MLQFVHCVHMHVHELLYNCIMNVNVIFTPTGGESVYGHPFKVLDTVRETSY